MATEVENGIDGMGVYPSFVLEHPMKVHAKGDHSMSQPRLIRQCMNTSCAEGGTGAEMKGSGQDKPCPDHTHHQDGEAEIS